MAAERDVLREKEDDLQTERGLQSQYQAQMKSLEDVFSNCNPIMWLPSHLVQALWSVGVVPCRHLHAHYACADVSWTFSL